MVKNIATVGIYVDDQSKAATFWTEKIGFGIKGKKDMGNGYFWLEVAPKGAATALVVYPKQLMKNFAELKPSIVFDCENIDSYCALLKEKGVHFNQDLSDLPWGKFASFLDEDGNEFGLRQW